jgi:hypothetical protein
MWNILYIKYGELHRLGPFESQDKALWGAAEAQNDITLTASMDPVYIQNPDGAIEALHQDDIEWRAAMLWEMWHG